MIKFMSTIMMFGLAATVFGQSSSLYLTDPKPPQMNRNQVVTPQLEAAGYASVMAPKPRTFAKHDLVTIIIRESSSATLESELETEKETGVNGSIKALPRLQLADLIKGELNSGDPKNPIEVDVTFNKEFEGEGDYARKDSLTTRLTARVIDVKPNGTLALEARTFIQNDDEKLTIAVTGFCRAEDVAIDNTVLGTQMFDLRVNKSHEGELRKTTKKGILTKLLEAVFNF